MTVHTEQRWSAETETIAAVALEDVQPPDGSVPDEAFFADARRVLAALADSGRLLPDGGETRTEFRHHDTVSGGAVTYGTLEQVQRHCARRTGSSFDPPPHPCSHEACSVTEWSDGREYRTPWEPIRA